MSRTFYPITPVEVTPGTAGAWTDVDCSSHIPAGATGVILHFVDPALSSYLIGFRKNGSTDSRYGLFRYNAWVMVGVDGSRICELKLENITGVDVYLVGYTTSGVTFATNAAVKNPAAYDTWSDIDCSTEAPNAVGLIFEVVGHSWETEQGLRKNGSTDNRNSPAYGKCWPVAVIGCDGSQICEGWREAATNQNFYLIGYITDGVTFNTNATDMSLGSTGAWTDLGQLPAGAGMGIFEVCNGTTTTYNYGLRKNGSSEDIYAGAKYHGAWAVVECDTNRYIEGKIADAVVDFFLIGYAEGIQPPTVTTQAATSIGPTSAAGNGNITSDGGESITQHGVCYKNGADPVNIAGADGYTEKGAGAEGAFTSIMSLATGIKYYCRAYATNTQGTSYGDAVDFITNLLLTETLAVVGATNFGLTLTYAETLALADSAAFQKNFVRPYLETMGLADGDIEQIVKTFTENLGLADSLSKAIAAVLAETLGFSDAVQTQTNFLRTFGETLSLSDQIQIISTFYLLCTETLGLSDQRTMAIAKGFTEAFPLADAVSKTIGKLATETLDLSDSFSRQVAFVRLLSETLGLADGDTQHIVVGFTEALALADETEKQLAFVRTLSEILSLADAVTKDVGKPLTETMDLADAITKAINPLFTEALSLSDSVAKQLVLVRTFEEILRLSDRLRIGGVWDNPTTHVLLTILKATLKTERI